MGNITVDEMFEALKKARKEGKGKYSLVVSNDNEGNGYHGCFFTLTPASEMFDGDIMDSNHKGHEYFIIG